MYAPIVSCGWKLSPPAGDGDVRVFVSARPGIVTACPPAMTMYVFFVSAWPRIVSAWPENLTMCPPDMAAWPEGLVTHAPSMTAGPEIVPLRPISCQPPQERARLY